MDKIGEQQVKELKEIVTILQRIDGQMFFEEISSITEKIALLERGE